jgi:hypothetical protein
VLEAGGGVGQADPLLDLVKRQALLEGECFGYVLGDRESDHDILSVQDLLNCDPRLRPAS